MDYRDRRVRSADDWRELRARGRYGQRDMVSSGAQRSDRERPRRATRTISTTPCASDRRANGVSGVGRNPSRLGTPRDAGVSLRSSRTREERRRAMKRTQRNQLIALATLVVVLGTYTAWRYMQPTGDASHSASLSGLSAQAAEAAPAADPTPIFATYRSLSLYLPVAQDALTEIAFHQASGDKAQSMTSLLPDADMAAADQKRGTGRSQATSTSAESSTDAAVPAILTGSVLRMWRSNRSGPCDTAVDVGALPGTPVLAPVTGTVVEVRAYKLYDKYDDFEVHIRPDGWPQIDVVLIHIDRIGVKVGDQVVGGVTPVAVVRKLSDRVDHQLGRYTKDGGDHVHVQVNTVEPAGMLPAVGES